MLPIGTDLLLIKQALLTSFSAVPISMIFNKLEPKHQFSKSFTMLDCDPHFEDELRQNGSRSTKTTCTWNFQHKT